ncbi:MAG: hypothetical protein Q8Q09_16945 [Deltaproteobacteria bacterium]|nr:hypothetical protein [Deltaproteobacteria bacterium]
MGDFGVHALTVRSAMVSVALLALGVLSAASARRPLGESGGRLA